MIIRNNIKFYTIALPVFPYYIYYILMGNNIMIPISIDYIILVYSIINAYKI